MPWTISPTFLAIYAPIYQCLNTYLSYLLSYLKKPWALSSLLAISYLCPCLPMPWTISPTFPAISCLHVTPPTPSAGFFSLTCDLVQLVDQRPLGLLERRVVNVLPEPVRGVGFGAGRVEEPAEGQQLSISDSQRRHLAYAFSYSTVWRWLCFDFAVFFPVWPGGVCELSGCDWWCTQIVVFLYFSSFIICFLRILSSLKCTYVILKGSQNQLTFPPTPIY